MYPQLLVPQHKKPRYSVPFSEYEFMYLLPVIVPPYKKQVGDICDPVWEKGLITLSEVLVLNVQWVVAHQW